MAKFDTRVQKLKYDVLKEVATSAFEGTMLDDIDNMTKKIFPDQKEGTAAGLYLNREIAKKRIRIALGGNLHLKNSIEVVPIACHECPIGGYEVTNACQGCLAHRCVDSCKFGAISIDANGKASINKDKCKECGLCSKNCPYGAIIHLVRPCKSACKVDALKIDEYEVAEIDNEKCISCGACSVACPFGAIIDKSCLVNSIEMIQRSDNNKKYKVYAIVAPAIASQFKEYGIKKIKSAIKKLGFYDMIETAYGADLVAMEDAKELIEKGFVTSSCCPAFVKFIKVNYPDLACHISTSLSPMAALAKYMKKKDPSCKVVFIGPCTAKKQEIKLDEVKKYVDSVMTFEELQAMIDSRDINMNDLEETKVEDASYFGRIFARSGGVTDAVAQAVKELGSDMEVKPEICNGIEACKLALLKKSKGILDANFIEGMVCDGGCIGGAGCFTHGKADKTEIDNYGKESKIKTIKESLNK